MKKLNTYLVAGLSLMATTSCSDFLDTKPYDELGQAATWKTEADAQKFLVGCYDGWIDETGIFYWDCTTEYGYANFPWEGFRFIGNGSMAPGNAEKEVANYYGYGKIRQCLDFIKQIENVPFEDETKKKDMIAQVKTILANDYIGKSWIYGDVSLVKEVIEHAEDAKVARAPKAEVDRFIEETLDAAIPDFKEDKASTRGYIDRATALALKMRHALYTENWSRAVNAAEQIMGMNFELHPSFAELFSLKGKDSKEIIASVQHIPTYYGKAVLPMYNNNVGGWSSMVPAKGLVDEYEMDNGLTKEEALETGYYDPAHPFVNRDPRMAMTVVFPGADWVNPDGSVEVFNTFDEKLWDAAQNDSIKNPAFPEGQGNASKTALTWGKYLLPITQYDDLWDTGCCPIYIRYAEVLLSYAEAKNELDGPCAEIYAALNQVRNRVGMPNVDEAKYGTKASLRKLIRRERGVELAGEGLHRADILRWTEEENGGKMMAERVMNVDFVRFDGEIDYTEPDQFKRATIEKPKLVEKRVFKPHNKYLPLRPSLIEKNPNLTQTEGY